MVAVSFPCVCVCIYKAENGLDPAARKSVLCVSDELGLIYTAHIHKALKPCEEARHYAGAKKGRLGKYSHSAPADLKRAKHTHTHFWRRLLQLPIAPGECEFSTISRRLTFPP